MSNREFQAQRRPTGLVIEASEGSLVTVRGVVSKTVTSDLPYEYTSHVNDGSGEVQVFVRDSTQLDLSAMRLGKYLSSTEFTGEFDAAYAVQPRVQGDVRLAPSAS